MMKLKTLREYADEVYENRGNPHLLADLQVEMACKCAYLSEKFKPIKVAKAAYWQGKYIVKEGEKPKSDTYMETQWGASPLGIDEIKLKIELEGLDRLISACKSIQVDAAREARNI